MKGLGIYIHVPFCGRKCGYCDFYSVNYSKSAVQSYVDAVLRNIRHYSDRSRIVDTVYFGGGTPSLLDSEQIAEIMDDIGGSFFIDENAEVTLEANPSTLNPDKLAGLRNAGVNRLSIGVQSMVESELKFLGRNHSAERAEKSILDANSAGFENISCDLMIALPEQTAENIEYSVNRLSSLPIQHISAYILKTEEGTPFDCEDIKKHLPDDDETADIYLKTVGLLEKNGFMQYEVSNFAKSGYESRHNCKYWKCEDYIGIGPSAHSCYKGQRFAVERDLNGFISAKIQPVYVTESNPCGFEETAMLRLRLKEGLLLRETGSHKGDIAKKIPDLERAGYINFDGERISLTPQGFVVSNSVISYLIY
jgi:putative coproporphyrinogen dehydrogenase